MVPGTQLRLITGAPKLAVREPKQIFSAMPLSCRILDNERYLKLEEIPPDYKDMSQLLLLLALSLGLVLCSYSMQ